MRTPRGFALVLLAAACNADPTGVTGDDDPAVDDVDAAPGQGGDPDAGDPDDPDAAPDPGDGVEWFIWDDQQRLSGAGWGDDLTDVANHLPASYGDQYWSDDAITAAHETSHGIHAHLRNHESPSDVTYNAFYVLGDRAAFVLEPDIYKHDVAAALPVSLRGWRYDLYLEGQVAWDDRPLYVFDEWNAYINGAEIGIDQVQGGTYQDGWTDAVMGPLEFSVYAIATALAVSELDPDYFASNTQFRAFTAWNLRRAMALYEQGRVMAEFEWEDQEAYAVELRTGTGAGVPELRAFARATWGEAWCAEVLGF